jgi:hypothetical protein
MCLKTILRLLLYLLVRLRVLISTPRTLPILRTNLKKSSIARSATIKAILLNLKRIVIM